LRFKFGPNVISFPIGTTGNWTSQVRIYRKTATEIKMSGTIAINNLVVADIFTGFQDLSAIVPIQITAAQGTAIYQNAFLTNPNMSKAKALAYIDTVMNYMNPRIAFCLNLSVGVDEIEAVKSSIKVQPNPAGEFTELVINNAKFPLQAVRVFDLLGKQVFAEERLNDARYTLNRNGLAPGMYLVKMEFNGMSVTEKVFFN
jgi:hypothetical protein